MIRRLLALSLLAVFVALVLSGCAQRSAPVADKDAANKALEKETRRARRLNGASNNASPQASNSAAP